MKFLAVDTANEYMCVIAYNEGKVASAFLPDCTMRHSTEIMKQVETVLAESNLTLPECDFFAAVVGAGSFTGIRIGISAVKGFCLACGKPSLPVTSFEVAAYNAVECEDKNLCIVDALHDAYYVCGFDRNLTVTMQPAYLTEAEVLALVENGYALRAVRTGEAWKFPLAEKATISACNPVEGLLAAVLAKGEKGCFAPLDALYVRKSSAELNLEKA